jgi:osomolarity two-component system response regulator SKN7
MRDRRDLLEEIRRKTPGKTKKEEVHQTTTGTTNWNEESINVSTNKNSTSDSNINRHQHNSTNMDSTKSTYIEQMKKMTQHLQLQVKELQHSRTEMENHLQQLNNTDCLILQELMDLGKQMQVKDNLIQDFLKNYTTEKGKKKKKKKSKGLITY